MISSVKQIPLLPLGIATGVLVLFLWPKSAKAAPKPPVEVKPPPVQKPPPPPVQKTNCSPTWPQRVTFSKAMTPEQVAKAITGRAPSAAEPLDTQLLAANPNGGPGWSFVYRIEQYDSTGNTKISTTRKTFDHYVDYTHAVDQGWASPGSKVFFEVVLIAAGTSIALPSGWNVYLHWNGSKWVSDGDGTKYPPCGP